MNARSPRGAGRRGAPRRSAASAYEALERDYRAALNEHLAGVGEAALEHGYELGRAAMAAGVGALALTAMHDAAIAALLAERPPEQAASLTRRSLSFLTEVLSPFEMGFLGFQEANATLRRLNKTLEATNTELKSARADAEREAAKERALRMELERTHAALRTTQAQLVQAAKLASIGPLAAGVAHEVNNPLAVVISNTSVVEREVGSLVVLLGLYQEADGLIARERPELCERIREATDRADLGVTLKGLGALLDRSRSGLRRIQKTVKDLRDFVRLDEDERAEVDLNDSVELTLNLARGRADARGVTLESDTAQLPPIICSPAKINEVLLNLVVNGIDACDVGGTVTISSRPVPEGVRVDVIDDGVGIAPSVIGRIFDPFFTTKAPGEGMGLGLSASHGIVREHGGEITVTSTPGHGARFTVFLPRHPPPAATTPAAS